MATLFAAFLGYNPMQQLLGPSTLHALPAANAHTLTGREFFPHLISGPFHDGLMVVFWLAIAMAVIGAVASALPGDDGAPGGRGGRRTGRCGVRLRVVLRGPTPEARRGTGLGYRGSVD